MNINDARNVSYIGPDDLIFNNDQEQGIHSGGFNVNSILLKSGISPIVTMNNDFRGGSGGNEQVSDLFQHLVVPNWALSYNNRIINEDNNIADFEGGTSKSKSVKHSPKNKKYQSHSHDENDDENDSDEDDVIDDTLYEKLLDLVRHTNSKQREPTSSKHRKTKRAKKAMNKKTKRQR